MIKKTIGLIIFVSLSLTCFLFFHQEVRAADFTESCILTDSTCSCDNNRAYCCSVDLDCPSPGSCAAGCTARTHSTASSTSCTVTYSGCTDSCSGTDCSIDPGYPRCHGGTCSCSVGNTCSYTCDSGWYNDDNDGTDGCENAAPTWLVNSSANNTNPAVNNPVLFYSRWNDLTGDNATFGANVSMFIFSWNVSSSEDCSSGTWYNNTATVFQAGNWTNVTKTIHSNCGGKVIGYRFYANDTKNRWNVSSIATITVQGITPPTYSNNQTNTTVAGQPCEFRLEWNDDTALEPDGQYIFSISYNTPNTTITGVTCNSPTGSCSCWVTPRLSCIEQEIGICVMTNLTCAGSCPSLSHANMSSGCDVEGWCIGACNEETSKCSESGGSCSCQNTGSCSYNCESGWYDCDGNATNGCEFNSLCWVNATAVNFTSTPQNATNVSTLPSTVGTLVQWKFYAKDNAGNWNVSDTYSLVTVKPWLNVTIITPNPSTCNETNPCKWYQYNTFWVNTTVTCRNGDCGNVYGTLRYNASSVNPDTPINTTVGDQPFYVTKQNVRPASYSVGTNGGGSVAYFPSGDASVGYDDGYNSTDTYAQIYATSVGGWARINYTYYLYPSSATLFFTIDNGTLSDDTGIEVVQIYNFSSNTWYNATSTISSSTVTYAVVLNTSSGLIKSDGTAIVSPYVEGTGSSPFPLLDFYDTYASQIGGLSCGSLSKDQSCQLNWTVNATGAINSYWKIGVLFNSSLSSVANNHTNNATIKISPGWLNVTLTLPTPNTQTNWLQYTTHQIQARVECEEAPCGSVQGLSRYNKSSSLPNTSISLIQGDIPFYVINSMNSSWNYTYDSGSGSDIAYGVTVDSNNNIIVAGYQGTNSNDWRIMKFNSSGVSLWNRTYNLSIGSDQAQDVAVDSSDNIIVAGLDSNYLYDWHIMKFDSSGNSLWNYSYNSWDEAAYDVATDSQNNIIVVGTASNNWRIMKFNSSGASLWNYSYSGGSGTEAHGVAVDSQNNIIVVGHQATNYFDWRIMKFNSSGASLWNYTYNSLSSAEDLAQDVAVDSSDNIIVVGQEAPISDDWRIMKFNSSGASLWNYSYNSGGVLNNDHAYGVDVDSLDNVIVVGDDANSGWRIMRFDSSGNSLWNYTYSSGSGSIAYDVTTDSNNNIIVAGYQGTNSAWRIMKFNPANPLSCGSLSKDQSCQLNWTVNVTGAKNSGQWIDVNFSSEYVWNDTDDALIVISPGWLIVTLSTPTPNTQTNWFQNISYWINATVECKYGDCGIVNGTARYGATNPNTAINTTTGATPFYITGFENPESCGNLNQSQSCQLNWTVNVTGAKNTIWKIDVNFSSNYTDYNIWNDTDDAIIKIILVLIARASGTALYYYTGQRVNGNITIIPVESPEDKYTGTVTNGEWSSDFYIYREDIQYITMIVDDNQKMGYNELKLNTPTTAALNCTTQNISLSGYSVDVNSGSPITSGNVKISVLDTDYTNTTTFSGNWGINIHPCLISGKTYTLQILISDNTGKGGEILQKYPAK